MTISEVIGWSLVHSLWQGTLIAAALAALLAFLRSPKIRYAAACVALLAMSASFAITLVHLLPAGHHSLQTLLPPALPPWTSLPDWNGTNHRFPYLAALIPFLAPLWLLGVCIFYLRYAAGCFFLHRLRHKGVCQAPAQWQLSVTRLADTMKVSRPVLLLESLLAETPVVLGHFRPVILVPLGFLAALPPDHVEAILLHELAHIKRADYLMNACQRFLEGLFFYHPAVWWISRAIREERENCCDDIVVSLTGNAHSYASALTSLEQNRTEQTALAATGGNLMKRIKRLLYPKTPPGLWAPVLAAIVLLAGTTMVLSAWQTNDNPWQKWLKEDVVYIISDQEKAAFQNLKTDDERQHFIEQFWQRRDPTPGTPENEFKDEHYRRIAYANSHWAGNLPGWKTDRGRIYIRFGPPDEIDSHPSADAATHPYEDWRYTPFQGVGSLAIEFVDATDSGELRMTLDPKLKYKKP